MKKYLIDFIESGELGYGTVIEEIEYNMTWNSHLHDKKQTSISHMVLTNYQIIFFDPQTSMKQHSFDIHDFYKIKIGQKKDSKAAVASFKIIGHSEDKYYLALVKKELQRGYQKVDNSIHIESNIKRMEEIRFKIEAMIQRKKNEHRYPSKFEYRERSLKAIQLKLSPILADVYKNLVHDKKLITDSYFWKLHNSEALLEFQTNYLNEFVQRARRIRMAYIYQSLIRDKKPENAYEQRNTLKEIVVANTKVDDTGNQHYNKRVEYADRMYFQRVDLYEKYVKEEKMEDENYGVVLAERQHYNGKMEVEDVSNYPTTLPAMNIPNNPVKFEVKNDVMNTFLSRQRGRRPYQFANHKQRYLTTKTVYYLKIFYDCMDRKSSNIEVLQKEITELQKSREMAEWDKNMELQKFIKRAQYAYMKFRKTGYRL